MREVTLRVRAREVERLLDRLLPIVPGGVREVPRGRHTELCMRGVNLPALSELARVTGRRESDFAEREVSDDWQERRRADYEPDMIGGRLVVAPEWAPRSEAEIEIVLTEASAFGAGGHPTTRRCLELLLRLPPAGSLADLGCGTGVLAILAARLGWEPVVAVDIGPESVETARANGALNGVRLEVAALDLSREPAPGCDAFVANIPPGVHACVAGALTDPLPAVGLVSGFHAAEAAQVADGYGARGLRVRERFDVDGWSILVLNRGLPSRPA